MFDEISPKYDLLNRLLSFGLDIHWRKSLKKYLPLKSNITLLDLATGTADVPIMLIRSDASIERVYGIDLAEKMLAIGQEKIKQDWQDR